MHIRPIPPEYYGNPLGIEQAILTIAPENAASLTVVRRNGGVGDGVNDEGELRFWIDTSTAR